MSDLHKHRREVARALANNRYEVSAEGIVFPTMGNALVAGVFDAEHRRGGDVIGQIGGFGPNIVPTEGLNKILTDVLATSYYVALFEGNVTPGATLTAATFTATTTECVAYDEATRVLFVKGAIAGGVVDNSASRAEFTMNAGKTIYGGALLSSSTKSGTTGSLLAAAKFSSSRAVIAADVLAVKYTLTLTSS